MRLRNVFLVVLGVFLIAPPILASVREPHRSPFQRLLRLIIGHEERITELEACACCCEGVLEPVCGADGRTWVNACEAECAGVAVVASGACIPGCLGNESCADGEFCGKPPGACDETGTCQPRPDACPEIFDPVCGCDGVTYGNACVAAANGVSVAQRGECTTTCFGSGECAPGDLCGKAPGACDSAGTCRPRPEACPLVFDPVCGCDGVTYGNACEAARNGVSVAHRGECTADCLDNGDCAALDFCSKATGMCDAAGVCQVRPTACPEIFDPVCGCDGSTYVNDCFAAADGVNVERRGGCGAACGNGVVEQGEECDDGNNVNGDGCNADCTWQSCGGFAGFRCPDPYVCVDDPRDECDPRMGGADCAGICVLP
jgi:cysteine-rich repeat protein